MVGLWDRQVKKIVGAAPQDFTEWLLKGAHFERELSPHLQDRSIDADILHRIVIGGQAYLLHIEFQKRGDSAMAKRIWEYNVLATCKFNLPVYSFVIYLVKDGKKAAESPYRWELYSGECVHQFQFGVVKLWEIPAEILLQTGLKGLLPLAPLGRDGERREVVEEAIKSLCPASTESEAELLALTYGFASLVFKQDEDQAWLRRRFGMLEDMLSESWAFQEIYQQSYEKALKQIRPRLEQEITEKVQREVAEKVQREVTEKVQREEQERERQTLLSFVQARFPALLQLAREQGALVTATDRLQTLILNVGLARDEAEARHHLLAVTGD